MDRQSACPFFAALPSRGRSEFSTDEYAECTNCLPAVSRRNFVPVRSRIFNERNVPALLFVSTATVRTSSLRNSDDRWATTVLARFESGGALSAARTCLKIALLRFYVKKLYSTVNPSEILGSVAGICRTRRNDERVLGGIYGYDKFDRYFAIHDIPNESAIKSG